MRPKAPIVDISHVSKSYRRGERAVPVLVDINLEIPEGEFIALMGPSGSGKSTLLNLVAALDNVDSGTIRVGGIDITDFSESALAAWRAINVGFIFQFYNLIPVLTALENVELPLLLTGLSRQERREHGQLALRVVGLADRMDHYPSELSGGQQQRVAVARALANDPPIIIGDEITGDLDSETGFEVMRLIRQLNQEQGKTVIFVTHDPRMAEFADRTIHLLDGVIHAEEVRNPK